MWDWTNANSYWEKPAEEMFYLISRWNNEKNINNVLDVGAGRGRNAILFAKNSFNVTALDNSKSGLQIIREKNKDYNLSIDTINADMHKLPFKAECFDAIVAYHSIYHTDWEGLQTTISELFRVLKPNGELFATLLSSQDSEYVKRRNDVFNKTLLKCEEEGSVLKHVYVSEKDIEVLFHDKEIICLKQIKEYYGEKNPCHFYILIKK